MDTISRLKKNIEASIKAKEELHADTEGLLLFACAVAVVMDCYKRGGRIYIAGNGGTVADALKTYAL